MKRINQKISTEGTGNRFNEGFECMDDTKIAGLESMALVQDVKANLKAREAERLEAKYGSRSPQVVKARAKVKYHETVRPGIQEQVKIASIKTPPLDIDSWRIQGRVVNQELQGIEKLTVSLFDNEGNWIRELGQACTDENGFFAITYQDEQGHGNEKFKDQPLILTASDKDQQVLHQEEEPLFLEIGKIDYRLIILGEEKCVTPPLETKDTWAVRGIVVDAKTGKPLENMSIKLWDEDGKFSDQLGIAKTDAKAQYELCYRQEEFEEMFKHQPKFQVWVFDPNGTRVYQSEKTVQCIAGNEDVFDIKIKYKDEDVVTDPSDEKGWILKGVVKDNSRKVVRGVRVALLDKDQVFSDELKSVVTNEKGQYQWHFAKEKYPALFEKRPAFKIMVIDKNGEVLYTSRKTVQVTEGKVEVFNIKMSGGLVR